MTSEAQRRAIERYKETEKGKAAQQRAVRRYLDTEQGQEALKRAQEAFEASEQRKAYKREWMRQKRSEQKHAAQEAPE